MGELVALTVSDAVATIRIDRPPMNAIDLQVMEELHAAAREAGERDDVGAVVLWGGDRVFAAGADVKMLAGLGRDEVRSMISAMQDAYDAVEAIPRVVIAAVNGFALGGGCELALCADFRFVAEDARLGQPEILLGIIPGAGGTQRLARLVGPSKAKDLVFSGRFVKADEALAIGLVDAVVPAADVYDTARSMMARYVGGPAYALRAAKEAIDRGLELDLESGLEIERTLFAGTFATKDQALGMRHFVEKGKGPAPFEGA